MPVVYECQRCTACCQWPGQVKVTEAEITRLAAFFGMSEAEFIQNHTRLRADRKGLALLEKANGECAYLNGRDCLIETIKPQQCRDFPHGWNFPGFEQVCQAKAVKRVE